MLHERPDRCLGFLDRFEQLLSRGPSSWFFDLAAFARNLPVDRTVQCGDFLPASPPEYNRRRRVDLRLLTMQQFRGFRACPPHGLR